LGRFWDKGVIEILWIFGQYNRGNNFGPLFSSLVSEFVERGCRNILKEVIENIIHNRRG
jgi:hypothetical protein